MPRQHQASSGDRASAIYPQIREEPKKKDYDDYFTDLVKITGCWNGLGKRMASESEKDLLASDTAPMRRAVAFSNTIAASKRIKELFAGIVEKYAEQIPEDRRDTLLRCDVDHVDGTMNALKRGHLLDWLKEDTTKDGNVCRILSNARCLSEGVDVPEMDAVLFLNPRNSVVDVVQAVGRVMRRAEGKRYGYIILPIGIPADTEPEVALKDSEKYKVVWQVLQALRSHDERIEAAINKIDLTGKMPNNVAVVGVGGGGPGDGEPESGKTREQPEQTRLDFPNLSEWRDAIFAKIVLKCGDRRYWESWAKDVAVIAERQVTRIKALLEADDGKARRAFDKFLAGLRGNLNPAVSEADAIEMLAQHLITQPVFDALFEGYAFTQHNPVSKSMQKVLDVLHANGLGREAESLEKFYASVRLRASGIDNAQARQRIVIELYDKFFKTAFPRLAKRLGIVYTPVEVVDFILNSADYALRQEFGVGLTDRGVHVLDPFAGTGTFIVRLLQGGLIREQDIERKFASELHANELVLLAYYIAAVNIEYAYHLQRAQSGVRDENYVPFDGIVLTDTFQLNEGDGTLDEQMFPDNNARAKKQKAVDIRVIVGNPPYKEGDDSALDESPVEYKVLDEKIKKTYGAASAARSRTNIYDSYIRALRWAGDRIKDKGIVCFVTNGSFIDAKSTDGVRKALLDEFSAVYVFNLRGNQRTSGEQSRKEGGKVFGSGSRATVAITLLVKDSSKPSAGAIHYHDIGDYLTREDKLQAVQAAGSVESIPWRKITPNEHGDWINARNPAFAKFYALGDKSGDEKEAIFSTYSDGAITHRDAWVYNASSRALEKNVARMTEFLNMETARFQKALRTEVPAKFVTKDESCIRWDDKLLNHVKRGRNLCVDPSNIRTSMYRPFARQWTYFDKDYIWSAYQLPRIFPNAKAEQNIAIATSGFGKEFFALMVDTIHDQGMNSAGKCYPLYSYEDTPKDGLFGGESGDGLVRRDAISDKALAAFRKTYAKQRGADIGKEDLFYYVYGVLHSPEYKTRFEADLKKQLPRIPFARDFWAFSTAGRDLAKWHLNYETVEPYPLQQMGELDLGDPALYRVQKMAWGSTRDANGKKVADKTTLVYNSRITLGGIPLEALDYVVNGKPALEWIIERYQVTTDKDSGIVNDPNDWATEHNDPAYILNLVKRIVRVSVETVKIVNALPALEELQ